MYEYPLFDAALPAEIELFGVPLDRDQSRQSTYPGTFDGAMDFALQSAATSAMT
jgi:hypothetical protein